MYIRTPSTDFRSLINTVIPQSWSGQEAPSPADSYTLRLMCSVHSADSWQSSSAQLQPHHPVYQCNGREQCDQQNNESACRRDVWQTGAKSTLTVDHIDEAFKEATEWALFSEDKLSTLVFTWRRTLWFLNICSIPKNAQRWVNKQPLSPKHPEETQPCLLDRKTLVLQLKFLLEVLFPQLFDLKTLKLTSEHTPPLGPCLYGNWFNWLRS